jgi:vanillate/3-O-methylgallate O-demethylase
MGCIDEALCQPSTELVTRWGDHGKRIKDMRVTVDRFPLRAARRNQ